MAGLPFEELNKWYTYRRLGSTESEKRCNPYMELLDIGRCDSRSRYSFDEDEHYRPDDRSLDVSMETQFTLPNMSAARSEKKATAHVAPRGPEVPLNMAIDPVTGQDRNRSRVIMTDKILEESWKRARLVTNISRSEARKRDSRISTVLEAMTLLRHYKQLYQDMTGNIKCLRACEGENNLKLLRLRFSIGITTAENMKESEREECEMCGSVIRKQPGTNSSPEGSIALLKLERSRVKVKKEQLEKDLKGAD